MKDKGDNPIVGRETTDIYDGENHGYKENYSLEKDDLEAFATIWTLSAPLMLPIEATKQWTIFFSNNTPL